MTEKGDTREVTAHVTRLVATEDKEGKKQWEVQVRWPWTPASNKGGDKTYVYREQMPRWDADTKGAFNLLVEAGYTKKDRDGNYYDGSRDWMWFWRIIREIDHAPASAPQAAPATSGGQPPRVDLDQRIAWNSAVNNAVHLIAAWGPSTDDAMDMENIRSLASKLFDVITYGPPQHAPGGPQEAADEPEAPEQAQRPERDKAPGRQYCTVPEHNEAPLAKVPSSDRLGHPYRQDGVTHWCYGAP